MWKLCLRGGDAITVRAIKLISSRKKPVRPRRTVIKYYNKSVPAR